jgi:hypothetical protein
MLVLYFKLGADVEAWIAKRSVAWQLVIATALPALLIALFVMKEKYIINSGAALMGVCVGFVLERRWVGFESHGTFLKKAARFFLGVLILFALQMGLKAGFSHLGPEVPLRFVRYLVIGLWIGVGGPWLFLRLRLAEKPST